MRRRGRTARDAEDLALARRLAEALERVQGQDGTVGELDRARCLARTLSTNRALAFAPQRELTRRLAARLDLACDLAVTGDFDTAVHLAWVAEARAVAALREERTPERAESAMAARNAAVAARRARAELHRRVEDASTFVSPLGGDPVGEARIAVAKVIRQLARRTAAAGRPGLVCRNVLGLALQLLPAAHRPRFEEEFRGEVADLPRGQIRYAARQLGHAWSLRRSLASARAERSRP
ncbi:hypothetical protein AB0F15_08895 [Amycolatopsis sp. NPDC026612]|uniref:hypothetical protein n=1 Tax=Amycolatopsis sp. NPDC026612 TaxID=3155466 RepID=UPI0033F51F64